jgi:hypothetical protein
MYPPDPNLLRKAVLRIQDPVLLRPWIQATKKFGPGIPIQDHVSESLVTIFGLKILLIKYL